MLVLGELQIFYQTIVPFVGVYKVKSGFLAVQTWNLNSTFMLLMGV